MYFYKISPKTNQSVLLIIYPLLIQIKYSQQTLPLAVNNWKAKCANWCSPDDSGQPSRTHQFSGSQNTKITKKGKWTTELWLKHIFSQGFVLEDNVFFCFNVYWWSCMVTFGSALHTSYHSGIVFCKHKIDKATAGNTFL